MELEEMREGERQEKRRKWKKEKCPRIFSSKESRALCSYLGIQHQLHDSICGTKFDEKTLWLRTRARATMVKELTLVHVFPHLCNGLLRVGRVMDHTCTEPKIITQPKMMDRRYKTQRDMRIALFNFRNRKCSSCV